MKEIMTLENDHKTYNVLETLTTCEVENIPMIFDYHHYMANIGDVQLPLYLKRIFNTSNHFDFVPKVHLSSPKSDQAFRLPDYVSLEFVLPFLKMAKELIKILILRLRQNKNFAMQSL